MQPGPYVRQLHRVFPTRRVLLAAKTIRFLNRRRADRRKLTTRNPMQSHCEVHKLDHWRTDRLFLKRQRRSADRTLWERWCPGINPARKRKSIVSRPITGCHSCTSKIPLAFDSCDSVTDLQPGQALTVDEAGAQSPQSCWRIPCLDTSGILKCRQDNYRRGHPIYRRSRPQARSRTARARRAARHKSQHLHQILREEFVRDFVPFFALTLL